MSEMTLTQFSRDALVTPRRWLVIAALAVASVAHIPVIAPHLDEAPYMGVLFIVLTAACAVLAVGVLVRDSRAVYALIVVTCGLAVLGYVATRLVRFPMLADDVGNWLEPLGVVSIISESAAAAVALATLARATRLRVAATHSPPSTGSPPRPGDAQSLDHVPLPGVTEFAPIETAT